MKSRLFNVLLLVLATVLCGFLFGVTTSKAQTFTVDFSAHSGPNTAKNIFSVYQTPFMGTAGLPPLTAMQPFLTEAGVEDLRYEIGWGKGDTFAYDQINGTASNPTIDFTKLDPFMTMLKTAGVTPLLALTYDPLPFRNTGGSWKDVPNNLSSYQNVIQSYITHYHGFGFSKIYYEVWNEPDCCTTVPANRMFFTGSQTDYGNIYTHVLAAFNGANAAEAAIGGPAIAYDTTFLTNSGILNQRMDFASIHAYANAPGQLNNFRNALGSKNVPIFMTEYNSYTSHGITSPSSKHPAAAQFFEDAKMFLTQPNLQKVYWAQWIDDSIGMVTYSLHRKAIFNAYKIYQTLLPVNRSTVTPDGTSGVDVMAATDSSGSGIVVWNNNTTDNNVTVNLNNIGFSSGTANLYRIDSQNASYEDNPNSENLTVNQTWGFNSGSTTWTGTVPAQSLVFIKAISGGSCTSQTITFPSIPNHVSTDPPFTINATATSGLGVIFNVVSGPATVSGNTVTLNGSTGTVTVAANQAGNSTYCAAPPVDQSFNVTGAPPTATATFVTTDTTHQGNWEGVYGVDGYNVIAGATSYPSYATVSTTGRSGNWTTSTTDVRALQVPNSGNRVAGFWVCPSNGVGCSYNLSLNLTDGLSHEVALYALDWDSTTRSETIAIKDTGTGAILDSRTATSFHNGNYLVWTIKGNVTIVVTDTAGANAVLSGIFFGPGGAVLPTVSALSISPTSVTGGTSATGTVTLSGAAPSGGAVVSLSSNQGAASVPANVTVAAGATSANFTITTTTVSSAVTATIVATYNNSSQTASLVVNPAGGLPSVSNLSISPTSVVGGASATGTVTLSGAAPSGGAVVGLSSNQGAAHTPASVTVGAGATSANFTITTTTVSSAVTATITATYNNSSKTATLTVNPSGGGILSSGHTYLILNVNSGMAIQSTGGAGSYPAQEPSTGGTNQQWTATDQGGGHWKFTNNSSGTTLEIYNGVNTHGYPVDAAAWVSGTYQQWSVIAVGDGSYKIDNLGSGLLMEVAFASTTAGATLDQNPDSGSSSQHWTFQLVN